MFLDHDATPHVSGGRLGLGLVNTVLWRRSSAPVERLTSYGDLVRYVARAGWLPDPDLLERAGERHPRKARAALHEAIELREMLFGVFSTVAAGDAPTPGDLRSLNQVLAESLAHLRLTRSDSGAFGWRWHPGDTLDLPRWQVAASAGAILASNDRARLKQCPGERCGWVFIDVSSNQSRRWCDSRLCGNRARVRAHYERNRGAVR